MNKYWWLNEESSDMLERGYLIKGQSVEEKLELICEHASKILKKPELKDKFKQVFEMGWASLSSPIWANFGQGRALPISCITGDTWVNTHNGGKMAKDIKIGDLVLTHKNRFKSVTAIIPTKDKGDIWKLKVGTRMTNLYITGNHPVLTNLGWVNVENLDTKKHLIAVNGELNYTSSDYIIDLKPFVDYKYILKEGNICKAVENTSEKSKKLNLKSDYITYYSTPKEFINITEDIAWALGVWFAEGSLTISNKKEPNGIRITVNDKDENWVAEEWLQIMTKSFNLKGNIYKSEVTRKGKLNSWLTVNFNGKVVGNLFKSFGKGAKEKEVPDWVINLPKNKLQKFLDGILLGDGSKGKNGSNKITLANPKLLLQVYNMGLKLGHDMSLQMQEKAGVLATTSHVYTINFRGYETSLNKHSASSGVRFNDGLIYCPIKILEKTNKVEDVYDFTVDEDHSFSCAGVIVHNCFSSYVPDSLNGIYSSLKEVAIMTQQGGGTAGYFDLRPTGAEVTGGATSSGAMSFINLFDSTIEVVKQNNVRRGAFAAYMEIDHPEIKDFLEIKDKGHRMQTLNTAVNVSDVWMESMIAGDKEKRDTWALVLKSRREKGIPYINFTDNINKNKPKVYKDKNLTIWQSNLCVSGDTKILTDFGYEEIENLEGQSVNIWNGEEYSKVDVFKTGESKQLLNIVTDSGYELKCTPEHKFYIQRGYNRGVGINKLEVLEKKASELSEGDKLIKFELPIIEGDKELKYSYTQGFFSGDGYSDDNVLKSLVYLYGDKKKLLTYIDVRNKYTQQGKKSKLTESKAINISKTNDRISCYMPEDIINNKSFVPTAEYTIESRLTWLAGLLDSDGTITNNKGSQSLQIASINKEFLKDTQLMLQTLGVDSKVAFFRKEGQYLLPANNGTGLNKMYQCKEASRLLINENSLYKLTGLGLKCHRLKWEVVKPNRECSQFIKIKSVEELPDLYNTFCFTEPKRHLGMFNGILTGQCNEIMLPTSEDESLVCCLLSMNAYTYDEWKDTDAIELMVYFLDAVMEDFIIKAEKVQGMERALKFAKNHRALGIGILGYASYLQKNMIAFESFEAQQFNTRLFKDLQVKAINASIKLASEYGEPDLLKGYGMRNTTLIALAPTTSSSSILGQVSPSIEPLKSNYFVVGLAKGSFARKNKELEILLESKNKNTEDIWKTILTNKGSVQNLEFLSEKEKSVFKTFEEISPLTIIQQASARQPFICQGQSLNLLIPNEVEIKQINAWMIEAWKLGIKGLYYQRGTSIAKDAVLKMLECQSCEA